MNVQNAVWRITAGGHGDDIPGTPAWAARRRGRPQAIYGAGLWVFIGVATTLFTLFVVSYIMRMSSADAVAIAMPSPRARHAAAPHARRRPVARSAG